MIVLSAGRWDTAGGVGVAGGGDGVQWNALAMCNRAIACGQGFVKEVATAGLFEVDGYRRTDLQVVTLAR